MCECRLVHVCTQVIPVHVTVHKLGTTKTNVCSFFFQYTKACIQIQKNLLGRQKRTG